MDFKFEYNAAIYILIKTKLNGGKKLDFILQKKIL